MAFVRRAGSEKTSRRREINAPLEPGYIELRPNEALQKLWKVWLVYIILLLIPMVILIWGVIAQDIDNNSFFGSNVLKITLCFSPVLALLLLTSVSDSRKHKDLIGRLSGSAVLEIFDHIGMLDTLLASYGSLKPLPTAFRIVIVGSVCFSLCLSPLEMLENKSLTHPRSEKRKFCDIILMVLQMLIVNIKLLVFRLVMWLYYKHDASIFMAKNVIVLGIFAFEIFKKCEWCGYKQHESYSQVEMHDNDDDNDYV